VSDAVSRDRANIRTDIWNDDSFRALTGPAQLLYLQLLTSATLSYAGVADWRPKRLASISGGRAAAEVNNAAEELTQGLYIVIDEDTEEVLIRSFLKHDGLLQKPNVAKAMVTAWGRIYSLTLKGVVVHELNRLHDRFPDWRGFTVPTVQELLRKGSVNPSDLVSVRDAPLLTTNYLLLTTDYEQPPLDERVLEQAFEAAYSRWPKKTERKKSFEKFKDVAKRRDLESLVNDIRRFGSAYAASEEDPRFVPALVVWLNGERWTDDMPQPRAGKQARADENAAEFYRLYGGSDEGVRSISAAHPGVG
jgi:hypothetical protein